MQDSRLVCKTRVSERPPETRSPTATYEDRVKISMVPRRGLEPPRLSPLVPETSASTNSATRARALSLGCEGRPCQSPSLRLDRRSPAPLRGIIDNRSWRVCPAAVPSNAHPAQPAPGVERRQRRRAGLTHHPQGEEARSAVSNHIPPCPLNLPAHPSRDRSTGRPLHHAARGPLDPLRKKGSPALRNPDPRRRRPA